MIYLLLITSLIALFFIFLNKLNKETIKKLKNNYELLKHNNEIITKTFKDYNHIQNMSDNELNSIINGLCKAAKELDNSRDINPDKY